MVSLVTTPCVFLPELNLGAIERVFPKFPKIVICIKNHCVWTQNISIGDEDIMPLIGKVEEFQENDDWIEYTERLDQYFLANEITNNEKKRAVLLSTCGVKTYKLIRNLVSPGKPRDKTFAELVNIVKNHLNLRP